MNETHVSYCSSINDEKWKQIEKENGEMITYFFMNQKRLQTTIHPPVDTLIRNRFSDPPIIRTRDKCKKFMHKHIVHSKIVSKIRSFSHKTVYYCQILFVIGMLIVIIVFGYSFFIIL
ncbi:hypothetical protein EDI_207070 [Entamoeba dispar SAW760]|uniref:Uncharacterized protein n=1 Tax=Entamoeba dispar (strain ATCC PRA-260 / SAW760) TaxID=370354 RepID=B0EL71_ENTDS|nr:uncharacterized protein EDI_207070 [Entamoeba dispar SAW760]EDR24759.1 hypothetical protein EDI_207070 [Entamoeba dispar SAW760]|eukprot:EDR24759.1 hypothetical protein EDI_207070 [Entamoeba dispar SAW760]